MLMLACMDLDGGIGFEGSLPWHVSAELKHFKAFTMGRTLGVGSGTKLPALPGREVISLSRSGVTLDDFFKTHPDGIIIGGATIFELCLDRVDTIVLSVLPETHTCDCFLNLDTLDRDFLVTSYVAMDGFDVLTLNREL